MRLHRTGFYPDMSNVNKNITVEAKLKAHLRMYTD